MTPEEQIQKVADWVKKLIRSEDVFEHNTIHDEPEDESTEEDMIETESDCYYIVHWKTIAATCKTDSTYSFGTERYELQIDTIRRAYRFYNAIADEFDPELWLCDTDDKHILMHRRGTPRDWPVEGK